MQEYINAVKAPFVALPVEQAPRPAVMAVVWVGIGLVLAKIAS